MVNGAMTISIATWNLRFNSAPERTLAYLNDARWDIACLQEVNGQTSAALETVEGWEVVDGLKLAADTYSSWKRPHAVALVARNGWELTDAGTVANTPTPGRGVHANARRGGDAITVISWHAPNKAGEGRETKMAGYRAVIDAINNVDGPLVVGLDSNHWSLSTDLNLAEHDPNDPHAVENQFFSREPQHRLHDALVLYLRNHPDLYEEILRLRPNGPLEVTYKRGGTLDRFDYIMVSDEFEVEDVTHDYEGGREAGSDHGFVSATLALSATA